VNVVREFDSRKSERGRRLRSRRATAEKKVSYHYFICLFRGRLNIDNYFLHVIAISRHIN